MKKKVTLKGPRGRILPPSGTMYKLPWVNELGKEHNHVNNHMYLRFVLQCNFVRIYMLFFTMINPLLASGSFEDTDLLADL